VLHSIFAVWWYSLSCSTPKIPLLVVSVYLVPSEAVEEPYKTEMLLAITITICNKVKRMLCVFLSEASIPTYKLALPVYVMPAYKPTLSSYKLID
jgi:hypothetical protein